MARKSLKAEPKLKNLKYVALHAGIHEIECPHCKHRFDTTQLFKRLFQSILDLAKDGHRVKAMIGIFYTYISKARIHRSPLMPKGMCIRDDRFVLRCKMSKPTKRYLNPVPPHNLAIAARIVATSKKTRARKLPAEKKSVEEYKARRSEFEKRRGKKRKKKSTKKKSKEKGND